MRSLGLVSLFSLGLLAVGCGNANVTTPDTGGEAGAAGASGLPAGDFTLGVKCDDSADDLYGDPGTLPDDQGDIIRCVDDGTKSKAEIKALLQGLSSDTTDSPEAMANGGGVLNTYQGKLPDGGAHLYRVLYRTERGNGEPGTSVATMYVPDPAPEHVVPLMLVARGSRGQAPACAPSVTTPGAVTLEDSTDGRYVQDALESMVWPLVASGFAVAVTDSAGYANYGADGNPPAGYASALDAGKSFIDSGHALRKLLPEGTTEDVLMAGLSQGGHTVLSSLEVANDYPTPGKIRGAAVYSPLWFAQRAWGVAVSSIAGVAGLYLNKSSAVPVSLWYHYTHAELLDGPGEGVKLFKPELQSAVKEFVDTICWSQSYKQLADAITDPPAAGITAGEYFTPEFVDAVGGAASERSCDNSPDKALCEKWLGRYRDDHPVLTGEAGKVPLLLAYGLKDTTISVKRFKCGVEKLQQGESSLDFCIDPDANHSGIILNQSDYVNQWLTSKVTGAEVTLECPSATAPKDGCDPLLPND